MGISVYLRKITSYMDSLFLRFGIIFQNVLVSELLMR